jgi:hypothetical protein
MSLLDDLISYWKMDEASGAAIDSHGSNTLTDTNTVGAATGKVGGARDFELDNTEYFTINDNDSLSMGDIDFTLAAWVKLESTGVNRNIIAKYNVAGNMREYRLYYAQAVNRLQFEVSPDGGSSARTNANNLGAPALDTWYFIVAWHDSVNNELSIQVNNGDIDTIAHSTGVLAGTAPYRIGVSGSGFDAWDGLIDEVGVWKRVLTSDERAALYNGGGGVTYPFVAGSRHRSRGAFPTMGCGLGLGL